MAIGQYEKDPFPKTPKGATPLYLPMRETLKNKIVSFITSLMFDWAIFFI